VGGRWWETGARPLASPVVGCVGKASGGCAAGVGSGWWEKLKASPPRKFVVFALYDATLQLCVFPAWGHDCGLIRKRGPGTQE
jgi:hypothetical protein